MKVVCNRAELDKGLQIANAAVSTRTPKPVLQCVRLTAEDGQVALQATDMEVAVRYLVGMVDVAEPGEALVPADRVRQITSNSVDETLTLESDETKLFIRGSDAEYEIYGSAPDDFPPVADFSDQPGATLDAGDLRELIRKVVYAAAKENTRYAISGVKWELGPKQLRLVATDGRRLANAWGPCDGVDEEIGAIIPGRTMALLNSLLVNPAEPVTIRLSENQAQIQTQSAVLTTQLVEGSFPRYEDVIPKDNDKRIEFVTAELTSAVRRAGLLTNEESRGVKFSFAGNDLTLASQVPDAGRAQIKVPVKYDGGEMDIGFNPEFLLDALRVVDTETVLMELKDGSRPGVVKSGSGFLYVVMPVSLSA